MILKGARFALGWPAAVSHREIEHHEVAIEIEDDRDRGIWKKPER
jgi:hypothetical protein